MRCAIVHYHELALKGRNREYFEQRLVRNIQWTLKDLGVRRVENLRSRIRVVLPDTVPDKTIKERLTRVFGIANFSLAHGLPLDLAHPDLGALSRAVIDALRSESFFHLSRIGETSRQTVGSELHGSRAGCRHSRV